MYYIHVYGNIRAIPTYGVRDIHYTSVGFVKFGLCLHACWMRGCAGVPDAYKILHPFPIDIADQCCNFILTQRMQILKGITGKKMAGTNSQSERYNNKWLIWLVCREPLQWNGTYMYNSSVRYPIQYDIRPY